MHHHTLPLKTPIIYNGLSSSHPIFLQNPGGLIHDIFSRTRKTHQFPVHCNNHNHNNNGVEVSISKHNCSDNSLRFSDCSTAVKQFDVATLGNLCVDVVLNVPELPPSSIDERKAYMEQLSKSPPNKW